MKKSHWLPSIARNCDWSRKVTPLSNLTQMASRGMKTYSESRKELRNLQILKKMPEKSSQFLSSVQSWEPKSLDVALNISGVERISSEKTRFWSTLEAIWIEFWMKRALATLKICVLCGWWFSNQFDIVSETPWTVVSYALLAVVLWNGLEHLPRKARLRLYFKWFLTSICVNNYCETEKSWIF